MLRKSFRPRKSRSKTQYCSLAFLSCSAFCRSWKRDRPRASSATSSQSMTQLATRRALRDGGVSVSHLNAIARQQPRRAPLISAMTRKPSHLVSYTHSLLSNGLSTSVASIGRYSFFTVTARLLRLPLP